MSVVPASSAVVDIKSLPTVENDAEKNKANIEAIIDSLIASSAGIDKELAKSNLIIKLQDWPSSTVAALSVFNVIWYMGINLNATGINRRFSGSVDGSPISSGGNVTGVLLYRTGSDFSGNATFQIISTPTTTTINFSRGNYLFGQFIANGWIFPGSSGVNVYNGSGTWLFG